ncbi:MAG: hypothetical protein QGF59_25850 [Pirellulaceae bacterium]|nr:hypothetical protein [Pirellulaceae bacterium]
MTVQRPIKFAVALSVIAVCGLVGWLIPRPSAAPQERRIKMKARQYAFDPAVIRVNQGDTLRLQITSVDVIHGFYVEAYDIDAKIIPQSPYMQLSRPSRPTEPPKKVDEIVFVANRTGKFRYRCSHTCGTMHPLMKGELVVAPNRLFGAGLGSAIGFLLASCVITLSVGRKPIPDSTETTN